MMKLDEVVTDADNSPVNNSLVLQYSEEEEDFIFLGFRWFHQRINSEDLEGDAADYEEMAKEEKEWDEESANASEEVKAKIDNILLGLKKIKSISYDELLKAFDIIDIKGGIFNLHLSKHVELTNIEEKLILQEAQSTHEQLDFTDERLGHIQNIKIRT